MSVVPFKFKDVPVRVQKDENEKVWFVAKDIAQALGLSWKGSHQLKELPSNWIRTNLIKTDYGEHPIIEISEPGVHKLVFRSRKKEAGEFSHWLSKEVIPVVRKQEEEKQAHFDIRKLSYKDFAKAHKLALAIGKIYLKFAKLYKCDKDFANRQTASYVLQKTGVDTTPLVRNLQLEDHLVVPRVLGSSLNLSTKEVNRLLAVAGLQKKTENQDGQCIWELTPIGQIFGITFSDGKIGWYKNETLKALEEVI